MSSEDESEDEFEDDDAILNTQQHKNHRIRRNQEGFGDIKTFDADKGKSQKYLLVIQYVYVQYFI